jgi:hypothetical protein
MHATRREICRLRDSLLQQYVCGLRMCLRGIGIVPDHRCMPLQGYGLPRLCPRHPPSGTLVLRQLLKPWTVGPQVMNAFPWVNVTAQRSTASARVYCCEFGLPSRAVWRLQRFVRRACALGAVGRYAWPSPTLRIQGIRIPEPASQPLRTAVPPGRAGPAR